MGKNAWFISILSCCLVAGSYSVVFAGVKPPPPPKGEGSCSPGFWKNHTELWVGVCCEDVQCELLEANLNSRGPGSNFLRAGAANFLNSCLPEAACEENK